jgi:hypothetical protein
MELAPPDGGAGSPDELRLRRSPVPPHRLKPVGLIFLIATALVAIGVGIEGPLLGNAGGFLFIFTAPIAGLTAGLVAGRIAVRGEVAVLGALAVASGLVAGIAVGWAMWPQSADEKAFLIPTSLVVTGIPLAAGFILPMVWSKVPVRARTAILKFLSY